jgi:hypothetical protein
MNINAIDSIKPIVPNAKINFVRCSSSTEYQLPVNPRSLPDPLTTLE